MTLNEDRQEIADALSEVEGVKAAYPYPRSTYVKGDAFPLIVQMEGDTFEAGVMTWAATVVLGQDHVAADLLLDDLIVPLRAALRPVMNLTTFKVGTMSIEGGTVFVAQQMGWRPFDG